MARCTGVPLLQSRHVQPWRLLQLLPGRRCVSQATSLSAAVLFLAAHCCSCCHTDLLELRLLSWQAAIPPASQLLSCPFQACMWRKPQRSLLPLLQAGNKSSPGPAATPSRAAMVADRSPQAAASDAHIGAALACEAEPSGRSSGEEAQQSTAALGAGAGAAGAGARRHRSAKQDIPHGKTTASQRMTRASARRAAAELDHHQAPAGEEAVQAQPSEAVTAEGPSGTSEEDEGMMMMEVS